MLVSTDDESDDGGPWIEDETSDDGGAEEQEELPLSEVQEESTDLAAAGDAEFWKAFNSEKKYVELKQM